MNRGRVVACDTPARIKARLGGGMLQVACDRPARALDLLIGQPWVRAATLFGVRLHVLLGEGASQPQLAASLANAGIAIQSIEAVAPSLEDAFVTLTADSASP